MTSSPSHTAAKPNDRAAFVLRRAREDDAAAVCDLMAHPQVYYGTLQMPYPTPAQWVERLRSSGNYPHVSLVAPVNGTIAGMAGLHPVGGSPRCQHARSLGISVHPDYWGTGLANQLMTELLHNADHWMGVTRIELLVYTDNARAIRLYERHGFEREGTLRRYAMRDGQYADTLLMARLKP